MIDLRPIGRIDFADPSHRNAANPHGWNHAYVQGMDGRYVADCIARAKALDCQAVHSQDSEGWQYPQPISLAGDPNFTSLSPDTIKSIYDAGMWASFTFRDTAYVGGAQVCTIDPAATLAAKINDFRWAFGITGKLAAYWDSNVEDECWREGVPLKPRPASVVAKVRKLVGDDVLLMPEFEGPGYRDIPGVIPVCWPGQLEQLDKRGYPVSVLAPWNKIPDGGLPAKYRSIYKRARTAGCLTFVTVSWDAPDVELVKATTPK